MIFWENLIKGDFLQRISWNHSGSFRCIFLVNKFKVLWPNFNLTKHMLAKMNTESCHRTFKINFSESIVFLNFKVTFKSTRNPNCRQKQNCTKKAKNLVNMLFLTRMGNIII